uniref:Peptidase S1 domain-containing protein n=1 Tax=Trichobilharzia regenti TaxID=157069 RepID=A0AA85IWQ0_TRIRE|nr:unnamed protein product [Trichobilharzia regenti]
MFSCQYLINIQIICILLLLTINQPTIIESTGQLEYRIQNGFPVKIGEFPMVVLLLGRKHRCTGTIISKDKILTAGHCACGDPTYKVYANVTDLDSRYSSYAQYRQADSVAYPVAYRNQCHAINLGLTDNQDLLGGSPDISIFILDKPFNLEKGYVEIGSLGYEMPTFSGEEENTTTAADVIILGYGEDEASDRVGQLRFGIIKLSECPNNINIPTKGALCANINSNEQGPDVGDSGGPIFNEDGHVIGITSIAGNGWFVFSSVATHRKFIQSVINDNF